MSAQCSVAVKLNCCYVCLADLLLAPLLILAALAVPLPIATPPETDALPPRAALELLPLQTGGDRGAAARLVRPVLAVPVSVTLPLGLYTAHG